MRKLKITELNRLSTEQYLETDKTPLIVVLDNIRSLNNIGSVFRTADAFLIEAIYLCGITATPPNQDIHKTALGAEYSVPWKYFNETLDAITYLKKNNYIVYSIEQVENSIKLDQLQLDQKLKYAVVLGNEVKGVQQSVVDACNNSIEIPQYGTKHSLNISVTAGIILWDFHKLLNR